MGLRKHNRKHNILSLLEDKTSDYGDRVALGTKTNMGWEEFTYSGCPLSYKYTWGSER